MYLGSMWGALSVVAILFPGAASLLGDGVGPERSQIRAYYTFIPSVLAAFALLFLTSLRTELSDLARARRWAVGSFAASAALMFAFLFVKQNLVAIDTIEPPMQTATQITQIEKSHGLMQVTVTDLAGGVLSLREQGDPWDIGCLALLSSAFMLLTIAFGSLGINEYARR